jgi:hypothetical protein
MKVNIVVVYMTTEQGCGISAQHKPGSPVRWENQRLRVHWLSHWEAITPWTFVLEDESVGFRADGSVFKWRRGYDLPKRGSLYIPRPSGAAKPGPCGA